MRSVRDDRFVRACRREPARPTPVWFMRQAGRYLPEYRAVRARLSLLDIVHRPDVCAEVTLQPVRRLGVDAAILFSDISVLFEGLGVGFRLEERRGPVVDEPVRSAAQIEALRPEEVAERLPFVGETIRLLVRELDVPLIGFAGGPFTLASYLIEGAPSRTFVETKRLMHADPGLWSALMDRLEQAVASLLEAQVRAGASAVQIFDSWVGALSPADFDERVAPSLRRLVGRVKALGVPVVYFGVETAGLLDRLAGLGADVIGVDWRVELAEAWRRVDPARHGIQGNLDPALLRAPWPLVEARARAVVEAAAGRPGHIFNLGHGVPPDADPSHLERLVERVHAWTGDAGGDGHAS
ncbi:MAG: uroporphyrinogen decarboxylase [Limnochordaceae bacterium]|nr:uroporphyrinogen decarboxylase [Limnochordaceae bacterium]